MKVTKTDLKSTASLGIAGLVGGILYSLATIWSTQKTNTMDLSPLTESLGNDEELFSLFCQLQVYRKLDEKSFRLAVDSSDRLVHRRIVLKDKSVTVSLRDRPEAFMYLKEAMAALERILQAAKLHDEAKVPVEVHSLYVKMYVCLETNWKSIMVSTQDVGSF